MRCTPYRGDRLVDDFAVYGGIERAGGLPEGDIDRTGDWVLGMDVSTCPAWKNRLGRLNPVPGAIV